MEIDANDITNYARKNIDITFTINMDKVLNRLKIRLYIAKQLIRLAGWILNIGSFKIEEILTDNENIRI